LPWKFGQQPVDGSLPGKFHLPKGEAQVNFNYFELEAKFGVKFYGGEGADLDAVFKFAPGGLLKLADVQVTLLPEYPRRFGHHLSALFFEQSAKAPIFGIISFYIGNLAFYPKGLPIELRVKRILNEIK
jgi:hypothetical protein